MIRSSRQPRQGMGMPILTAKAGLQASGPSWVTVLEPAYPLGPRFAGPRQGLARGGSAPFDPPDARAPAEFAGGGLAPRPSYRCVLSRAPHEGHMAAGRLLGSVEGTRTMGNSPRTHEQSLRSEQPCRLTVEN